MYASVCGVCSGERDEIQQGGKGKVNGDKISEGERERQRETMSSSLLAEFERGTFSSDFIFIFNI